MSRRARAFAVATLIVAIIGIGALVQQLAGSSSVGLAGAPVTDLGVFEPVRGRIVYRVGSHLEAIDPLRPSVPLVIEPGGLGLGTTAMPAGFSADGSKLAIGSGDRDGNVYVLDRMGRLNEIPLEAHPEAWTRCCFFVDVPWLSPDGSEALFAAAPRRGNPPPVALDVLDLEDPGQSRLVELAPSGPGARAAQSAKMPVWSPDGSQAAYVFDENNGPGNQGVAIANLSTGETRELASGWGMIRQLAWSPDGSQVLLVAMAEQQREHFLSMHLSGPQEASLVLVDVDDGDAHAIASDYFVAASWSPDGSQIAAINFPRERDLVMLNADGTGRRTLLQIDDGEPGGRKTYVNTGVVWHPIPAR